METLSFTIGCTSMYVIISIQTLQQLAVELRLYGAHGHVLPIWSLVGVIEGRPAVQHVLSPGAIPHTDAAWFPHKRAHICSSFNLEEGNKQKIPLKITYYFPLSHQITACVGDSLLYSFIQILNSPSSVLKSVFEAEQKLLCVAKYPQDIQVHSLKKCFPWMVKIKTQFCHSTLCCHILVNSATDLLHKLASQLLKTSWCFVTLQIT